MPIVSTTSLSWAKRPGRVAKFSGRRFRRDFPFDLSFMVQIDLSGHFRDYSLISWRCKLFFNAKTVKGSPIRARGQEAKRPRGG
jgi:hypothetical protein